jgi:enamine deaminase RidA (YjgF/YER057c/UK114 family)
MSNDRQHVATGSPYEPIIGISRTVRVGNLIAVSGTAPLDPDGKTVAVGDAAAQARLCLDIVRRALEDLGSGLETVYRTRTVLTRITDWETVRRVHGLSQPWIVWSFMWCGC